MAAKTRPRTASRVAAVQALFQSEQAQTGVETVIDEFVRHRLGEMPDMHGDGGGFDDGRAPEAAGAAVRPHRPHRDALSRTASMPCWPTRCRPNGR